MKKYCSCGRLIEINSTCIKCDKDRRKEYNKRRDRTKDDVYRDRRWIKLRNYVRARDNYMCLVCMDKEHIAEPMKIVHHIQTVEDREDLRYKENNLISLCKKCHESIHEDYKDKDKKIKIQEYLSRLIGE